MIEEIHVLGVYMPAALAWAVLAIVLVYQLREPLRRLPLDRYLWHPGLIDLALFFGVWWAIGALADAFGKLAFHA